MLLYLKYLVRTALRLSVHKTTRQKYLTPHIAYKVEHLLCVIINMEPPANPKSLIGLRADIKLRIFLALPNLWTVVALRMTCHQYNYTYFQNKDIIRNTFRDRLVAAVDDYYIFLTTLYIDESMLRHPPAGGWRDIPPEASNRHDKDFVVDVARHLPYIQLRSHLCGNEPGEFVCAKCSYSIEHNCIPIDHSSGFHRCDKNDNLRNALGARALHSAEHCIELARTCSHRGGHSLYLDAMKGVIIDVFLMPPEYSAVIYKKIETFFDERKENFRALAYVAAERNVYAVEKDEPDEFRRFGANEPVYLDHHQAYGFNLWDVEPYATLLHQKDHFPTRLDLPWIRRLYRKYGWPGPSYQKTQALKAIGTYYNDRSQSSALMCFDAMHP